VRNYFNYFTEIEERYMQRRGQLLMLSTLDWALIEAWREAGIPLEAVLRGIDAAFDRYEQRKQRAKGRLRQANSLAWCAQEVMTAAEEAAAAAVGAAATKQPAESGFETERVAQFLDENAAKLDAAELKAPADSIARETATRLRELAAERRAESQQALEDLDRTLTVLEERLFAAITTVAPEEQLVLLREQAAREMAPYRSRMQAMQIRQIEQQFLHKRLMESAGLPRLSLFYMKHA
jgi:hypothetical protein